MIDFQKHIHRAVLDAQAYRMISIKLAAIGCDNLNDEGILQMLNWSSITYFKEYRVDRATGIIHFRWQANLSNDEIDHLSVGLIGLRGRKKRK